MISAFLVTGLAPAIGTASSSSTVPKASVDPKSRAPIKACPALKPVNLSRSQPFMVLSDTLQGSQRSKGAASSSVPSSSAVPVWGAKNRRSDDSYTGEVDPIYTDTSESSNVPGAAAPTTELPTLISTYPKTNYTTSTSFSEYMAARTISPSNLGNRDTTLRKVFRRSEAPDTTSSTGRLADVSSNFRDKHYVAGPVTLLHEPGDHSSTFSTSPDLESVVESAPADSYPSPAAPNVLTNTSQPMNMNHGAPAASASGLRKMTPSNGTGPYQIQDSGAPSSLSALGTNDSGGNGPLPESESGLSIASTAEIPDSMKTGDAVATLPFKDTGFSATVNPGSQVTSAPEKRSPVFGIGKQSRSSEQATTSSRPSWKFWGKTKPKSTTIFESDCSTSDHFGSHLPATAISSTMRMQHGVSGSGPTEPGYHGANHVPGADHQAQGSTDDDAMESGALESDYPSQTHSQGGSHQAYRFPHVHGGGNDESHPPDVHPANEPYPNEN